MLRKRCNNVICLFKNHYLQNKRWLPFTDPNTTVATSIGLSEVRKVISATTEYRLVEEDDERGVPVLPGVIHSEGRRPGADLGEVRAVCRGDADGF